MSIMPPFDDFVYLINHVLLGEEPTIEDFILLVGTLVAFIAFILWCCFPIQPKEPGPHRQFTCKVIQSHIKTFDAASVTPTNDNAGGGGSSSSSIGGSIISSGSAALSITNGGSGSAIKTTTKYQSSGSYSKNGSVAMHNYYVKNGHHCCT